MGIEIIIFLYALMFGSFLNVVICRLNEIETIIASRSHCRKCKKNLAWYDLVPLLSFVVLGGRCRYCKEKISWQYPLVEGMTGVLLVLAYIYYQSLGLGVGWLIGDMVISSLLIGALIVIFVNDLREMLIPEEIAWPAVGLALIYFGIRGYELSGFEGMEKMLLGGVIGAGLPALISVPSRGKWMGYGDIILGGLLGIILGYPVILIGLVIGFLIGGVAGVILLIGGKKKMGSAVPFGPFIITGAIIAWFYGKVILEWYVGRFY